MSYAANTSSGSVKFADPVRVGTVTFPAGTYAIHWEPGAKDVQVVISGHGHEVTVPATVAATGAKDEVLTHRDGSAQVVEGFTVKANSFTIKSN
jgi:hypothetical protein